MGQLIPVMCDECVPGDFFKVGNQCVIRFQPLVAPVMHEINMFVHYFFVPYRLLWDGWEEFITGGVDGNDASTLPTWTPTAETGNVQNSLWDYLGFPVDITPAGALPLDFPRRAYNLVYNEYYRDENLIDEVDLTNEEILNRCWSKDYFTSSLPFQQRGNAIALPVTGTTSAVWDSDFYSDLSSAADIKSAVNSRTVHVVNGETSVLANGNGVNDNLQTQPHQHNIDADSLNVNTVDLSQASTFDVADLRLAFQIQRWMERNARSGVRYTEFLQSHFGVSPLDSRLQRPEYIGGSKAPIIVSEVLQTSSTDETSPQGNLAGRAISVSSQYAGKCHVQEFGLIIGIMSVMPKPAYQQGIDRQWIKRTRYDFCFPEFTNLSEQAIENAEICATDDETHNTTIFGYQGRYDELRTKRNMVVGEMRDTFDYWHMGRIFDLENPPTLNGDFVTCTPTKRPFAVQTVPELIVNFGNVIRAFRPIPIIPEPGLIDHH
jgi:hypothetical protein